MTCLITRPFFSQDWEILSGKSRNLRNFCELQEKPRYRIRHLLIISDEEKHRAVIHAMVATLRGSLMWTRPEGSLEGGRISPRPMGSSGVSTDALIELEKEGIQECMTLVKKSSGYYHGAFKILLDSVITDSEKHIELLEYLKEKTATA